jgi:hypothetical protein
MLEQVKGQISQAKTRNHVWQALLESKQPMPLVLRLYGADQVNSAGEFFIEDCDRIVGAVSYNSGNLDHLAVLELFTVQATRWEIQKAPPIPFERNIEIKLVDLLSNENQVIKDIKHTLWPMASSSERFSLQPERDAVSERIRSEVEAASQDSQKTATEFDVILPKPFPLIVDHDDLAEKRRTEFNSRHIPMSEHEAASLAGVQTPIEAPAPAPQMPSQQSFQISGQHPSTQSAAATAGGTASTPLPFPTPETESAPTRTPSTRETLTKLRTLNSVKPEPAKPTPEPIKPVPKKVVVPAIAAAAVIAVMCGASMLAGQVKQRHDEDSEAMLNQVRSTVGNSAVSFKAPAGDPSAQLPTPAESSFQWVTMYTTDLHNPFRPPSTEPSSLQNAFAPPANTEAPAAGADDELDKGGESGWQPPAHPALPLSGDQLKDVEQQSRRAREMAAGGLYDQAAALYAATLVRYPFCAQLRIDAITAYVKLKNYAYAKKLAREGMANAQSNQDYVIFQNFLTNVATLQRANAR